MNTEKNSSLLFARESAIFWVASAAKIVSWVVLVFHLIIFVNQLQPVFQGQAQLPTQLSQWPIVIVDWFYYLVLGVLYFLILQGIAQGLNLGLDIYYELQPEVEDVDEEIDQE
jgi:hypothetical protein